MQNEPEFDIAQAQRWFAVQLNNSTWAWLENAEAESDPSILHAAHASCYHWSHAGDALNVARALYFIANVEARLKLSEAALQSAHRCLALLADCSNSADWDHAFGVDALARAQAAAGQQAEAKATRARARGLGDQIVDPQDKEIFDRWFQTAAWPG